MQENFMIAKCSRIIVKIKNFLSFAFSLQYIYTTYLTYFLVSRFETFSASDPRFESVENLFLPSLNYLCAKSVALF